MSKLSIDEVLDRYSNGILFNEIKFNKEMVSEKEWGDRNEQLDVQAKAQLRQLFEEGIDKVIGEDWPTDDTETPVQWKRHAINGRLYEQRTTKDKVLNEMFGE